MSPTRVVNKYTHQPTPDDVYIGRGSTWGNPFRIGEHSRDEAIARYEAYLQARPDLIARLPELRGKTLVCYCAPRRCHGDILQRLCEVAP